MFNNVYILKCDKLCRFLIEIVNKYSHIVLDHLAVAFMQHLTTLHMKIENMCYFLYQLINRTFALPTNQW